MRSITKALFLVLFFFATYVFAMDVTIVWKHPNPDVVEGFKLYWGIQSGQYDHCVDVGMATLRDGGQYEYRLEGLSDNQRVYFVCTAYNQYGESEYSSEVSAIKITTKPQTAPVIINIQIIQNNN